MFKVNNKDTKTTLLARTTQNSDGASVMGSLIIEQGFKKGALVKSSSVKMVFLEILQNSLKNLCARVWRRCFSVNFAKFLRTPFCTEHLWWLLLLRTFTLVPENSRTKNLRENGKRKFRFIVIVFVIIFSLFFIFCLLCLCLFSVFCCFYCFCFIFYVNIFCYCHIII